MSLIKWNKREDLFPSFSSMFDDFWGRDYLKAMDIGTSVPAVNVSENENTYMLDMAVPGAKKEDFNLEIDGNSLRISSEHKEEKKEDDKHFSRREFQYSSFERRFTLPDNTDKSAINANYENGILKISIPKRESEKASKRIEIK